MEEEILFLELQQLGLPTDISKAIVRCFSTAKQDLLARFAKQTLQLPRLQNMEWRVDYVIASSFLSNVNAPTARLDLTMSKPDPRLPGVKELAVEVSAEKLSVLLADLRAARSIMAGLEKM